MKFSAFISYNHADRAWAAWLHRSLERYRIPKPLRGRETPVGTLGSRLPPVFQDREELATSADLAQSVQAALAEAATLIVICSPNAARSRWVNEEVRTFIAQGRAARIQCLVVDGEPGMREPTDPLACFPPALLAAGIEPLAADVRPEGDGKRAALLKLIAGVLGVGYDELRRRDAVRRQRQLMVVAALSTTGLAGTSALAAFALVSRHEAIAQRDLARQRTATAERTVDFVKSMFATSDPSEAKGATITAREILDRGARRISSSLDNEPAVKIELLTTLGEVYTGLGLFHQGDALIRSTFRIAGGDPRSLPRQYAALGESQLLQSNYPDAIQSFKRGLDAAGGPAASTSGMEGRLLDGLSEGLSGEEQFPEADRVARRAVAIAIKESGPGSPDVARARETQGASAFAAGDLKRASQFYRAALQIRIERQGVLHPKTMENLNNLGTTAYLQRDNETAERYFRRALTISQHVLGLNHPDVATQQANLGRILLERRQFGEAKTLLNHASSIYANQRDPDHDQLPFALGNLALAEQGVGENVRAEALFRRAIEVARLRKHRNLAPAMTDLADLLCDNNRIEEGSALVDQARPIMLIAYPNDPWRTAWVDHVHGSCLWRSGNHGAGRRLLEESAPILEKRWAQDTLYGAKVRARLSAITRQ